MAISVQIQCINKSERQNVHERILSIGGVHNGTRWKMSQQNAIKSIEQNEFAFYVVDRYSRRADVIVSTSRFGHKYLKTVPDGESPNNLLSLPECP